MGTTPPSLDPEDLVFGLLENGLDFLLSGTRSLRDDADPRDLKYAVLHLAAGMELIHKEALRRTDWQLLFDNPERADPAALAAGSFKSVGPEKAIARLREHAGIELSDAESALLETLRDRRNRLQHFEIHETKAAITAVAARVVGVALDFIVDHLGEETLTNQAAEDFLELREQLPLLGAFVLERRDAIAPHLAAARLPIVTCVSCLEEAALVDAGTRCLFCRVDHLDRHELVEIYAADVLHEDRYSTIKDGGDWVVSSCPSCGDATLLDFGSGGEERPERRWVCFTCGTEWQDDQLDRCTSCGEWYESEEDGLVVCRPCFDYAISRE